MNDAALRAQDGGVSPARRGTAVGPHGWRLAPHLHEPVGCILPAARLHAGRARSARLLMARERLLSCLPPLLVSSRRGVAPRASARLRCERVRVRVMLSLCALAAAARGATKACGNAMLRMDGAQSV
jgi:hypothetical protein